MNKLQTSLNEQIELVQKDIQDVQAQIQEVEVEIKECKDVEKTRYLWKKEDRLRREKEQLRRERELLLQTQLVSQTEQAKPAKRRFTQTQLESIPGYRFDSLRPLKRQKANVAPEPESFLEVPVDFVHVLQQTRTNCLHGMFFKSDRYTFMEAELRSLLSESKQFKRPLLIGGAPGSGKSLALHLVVHDAIIQTGKTVFWFACDQRANYRLFKFSRHPDQNKLLVAELFHPNSPIMSVSDFVTALKTNTYLDKKDNEFHFVVSPDKRPVSTISNPYGNQVICVFDGVCGVEHGRSEADELLTAFGSGYPLIMTASLQIRLTTKAREGFDHVLVPSWTREEFRSLLRSPMAPVLQLYWSALRFYNTVEDFSDALADQDLTISDHKEAMEYLKQQVSDPLVSLVDYGTPHFTNARSMIPRLAPGQGRVIETPEELEAELERRYYYAGRNARFMVEKSIWNVARTIREQLETAIHRPALLDSTQGVASTNDVSTLRCIDYRVTDSGQVFPRPALVSRYVFQIIVGCLRASDIAKARSLMENPCYQGWLDEFELIHFLKSSTSIQLLNDQRFLNHGIHCLDDTIFDFPRFLKLKPGTWLIPAKYNHKLYDIVHVQGTGDDGLCLWFIQIGRPKVHAFKLDTFQYDLQEIENQHQSNLDPKDRKDANGPTLSFEYRFMYVFTGKLEPDRTVEDQVKSNWIGSVPSPYRDHWKPGHQTITKVAWTHPVHPTYES